MGVAYNPGGAMGMAALDFENIDGTGANGTAMTEAVPAEPIQIGYRYPTLSASFRTGFGTTAPQRIVHAHLYTAAPAALEDWLKRVREHMAKPKPLVLRDEWNQTSSDWVLTGMKAIGRMRRGYGKNGFLGWRWLCQFTFEQQKYAIGE